jgi:copper chaperone CopZ
MKTQHIVLSFLFVLGTLFTAQAQKYPATNIKKDTVKVWGECGMCKKTIEKAARTAGATTAAWDEDTKILAVSYTAGKANLNSIQQAIAAAGYDTRDFTAETAAYKKLNACCQYERKPSSNK